MRLSLLALPLVLFAALAAPSQTGPSEEDRETLPKPTQPGVDNLKKLVQAGLEGGALAFLPPTKAAAARLTVKDPKKLRALLEDQSALLTPALCDTLLTTSRAFDQSVLLQAVAEWRKDDRMLAFAALARGESLDAEGNFPGAVKHFDDAVRRFDALQFPTWQAFTLAAWAGALNRQGEHHEALAKYLDAFRLVGKRHGPKHPQTAACLANLGDTERHLHHLQKALDYHRAALKILAALPEAPLLQLSGTYRNIAGVLLDQGNAAGALDHYRKALEFADKIPDARTRDPAVGGALANLALTYHHLKDLDQALKLYQQSLAVLDKCLKRPHDRIATVLRNFGQLHLDRADPVSCLRCLHEALQMHVDLHGDRSWEVVEDEHHLADIYLRLGNQAQARDHYDRAVQTAELLGGKEHPRVAEGLAGLADVALQVGDFRHALELGLRGRAICERHAATRPAALAMAWTQLGSIHHRLGQKRAALDDFSRALALWQKLHGEQDAHVASAWHNLGTALSGLGDLERAAEALGKALAIREKLVPHDEDELAASYNSLGSLSYRREDYAQAADYHRRAWEALAKNPRTSAFTRAATLNNLGMSYFGLRQWPKALEQFDRALDELRFRQRDPKPAPDSPAALYGFAPEDLVPSPLTVQVLHQRGRALLHLVPESAAARDWFMASYSFAAAISVLEQLRGNVLTAEESRFEIGERDADLYALLIHCYENVRKLPGTSPQAGADLDELIFRTAELGTARAFLRGLAQARADELAGLSPELRKQRATLEQELLAIDAALAREQGAPDAKRDFGRVAELMARRKTCTSKLAAWIKQADQESPRFAEWRSPGACSLAEGRACLRAKEVALLFVPGHALSFVLLVEPGPAPLVVMQLPGTRQLAEQVAALTYPETLALPARTRLLGADAFAALLGPLQARLEDKDLLIVPGGPLCHLPFELLVEPGKDGTSHYLVENHNIRYAPSLTVLGLVRAWDKKRPAPSLALWAIGDPIYEENDPRLAGPKAVGAVSQGAWQDLVNRERSGGPAKLARLPYSGWEVRALRDLFGPKQSEVLVDRMASEAAVKAASASGRLAQARYVHFATHGILGLDDGRQPSLVLNLVGNEGEDGLLQLDEVAALKLNADLVVLSACRTGQGRLHDGEGVRGLARAFLHAGSKAVVCSLWAVQDEETSRLMVDFYRHVLKGQPGPEALRQAQLALIRAGQPPLVWAPFILIGE
jgi:CHAT domain-containing protein/tetratricopeptide (TPR) repeat protein